MGTASTGGSSSGRPTTISTTSCTKDLLNKPESVFIYLVAGGYRWAFSVGQDKAVDMVYYFIGTTVGVGLPLVVVIATIYESQLTTPPTNTMGGHTCSQYL